MFFQGIFILYKLMLHTYRIYHECIQPARYALNAKFECGISFQCYKHIFLGLMEIILVLSYHRRKGDKMDKIFVQIKKKK